MRKGEKVILVRRSYMAAVAVLAGFAVGARATAGAVLWLVSSSALAAGGALPRHPLAAFWAGGAGLGFMLACYAHKMDAWLEPPLTLAVFAALGYGLRETVFGPWPLAAKVAGWFVVSSLWLLELALACSHYRSILWLDLEGAMMMVVPFQVISLGAISFFRHLARTRGL